MIQALWGRAFDSSAAESGKPLCRSVSPMLSSIRRQRPVAIEASICWPRFVGRARAYILLEVVKVSGFVLEYSAITTCHAILGPNDVMLHSSPSETKFSILWIGRPLRNTSDVISQLHLVNNVFYLHNTADALVRINDT